MKMYQHDDRFFFDEMIEIGYCPICDKSLYLRPYVEVKKKHQAINEIEARFTRYSTYCDICGHRVELMVPSDPLALPKNTEIINIARFEATR